MGSDNIIKYARFLNPFTEFSEKAYMQAAITVPIKTEASRKLQLLIGYYNPGSAQYLEHNME